MVNYILLGSGTTDSNGIAKLEKDAGGDPISHSYTGTGAGEIDVVASLDSTIDSGSVVSQPYTVTDCLFLDCGISGGCKNTKWVNQSGYFNVSDPTSDGTTITKVSNGNYAPSTVANSTTWSDRLLINSEFVCEFDVSSVASQSIFRIYYNTNQNKQFELTDGHYKITVTSDTITYSKDNGSPVTLGSNLNITTFENVAFVNATLTFKNFFIYVI